MYGQKSISQSLLDAVNTAMFEDIHPQAQSLLKHIKPEHHSTYKPFLAKGTFNGSHKDKTDVLNAAKQAGHLVSENIEEGFKELMQDVKDRAGPQPKGHIGQKAGTRYGGAGQKDDEREKETERLDKKKAMKKESFGDFKNRLIESLKGNQHKIDKNKNNKIDAHDFKLLRAQKEEVEELDELSIGTLLKVKHAAVRGADDATRDGNDAKADKRYDLAGKASNKIELKNRAAGLKPSGQHAFEEVELDEANKESKKDFDARQARLSAAGKETAKDPVRLKRLSSIPGYTAAMNLAKKTTKEEVEIGPVIHAKSGKEIGIVTKQPNGGGYHALHSAASLAHKQTGTFDSKDKAHQFIHDAHAKAIKNNTLSDKFLKKNPSTQLSKEEVELDEAGEVKTPKGLTVDTLAGPKKAPKGFEKDNEHTSAKVPLKTEGKRPESDTVPFVTDAAQSPKERLRAALGKVKKEMSNGY